MTGSAVIDDGDTAYTRSGSTILDAVHALGHVRQRTSGPQIIAGLGVRGICRPELVVDIHRLTD